jgi:hypothetical protein
MSKIIISLCAFVILAITPSVHADTVVITSGTITLSGAFGGVSYAISGQNFSLNGGGEGGFASARNCTPCVGGSLLGAGMVVTGTGLGGGAVTLNGMTFPSVSLRGTLEIGGGGFTIPMAFTDVTLSTGFSLNASIFGCSGFTLFCDPANPIFTTTMLQGGGTATLHLLFSGVNTANGLPLFFFSSLVYDFGPSKEVPEPMTITLLAAGVLGLGAKLRLSNRSRRH